MMKYLRYLFITLCACVAFMFIDNASALSSENYVPIDGYEFMYFGNELITSQSFYSNSYAFGYLGFSALSTNRQFSNSNLSYRTYFSIPGSILGKYDAFSFIIGAKYGYFNTSTFFLRESLGIGNISGLINCSAISLPKSSDNSGNASVTFSSFTCNYDTTFVTDKTATYYVDLSAYTVQYPNPNNVVYQQSFYFGHDISFYTSDNYSVISEIKGQTEAINKQTEAVDKVDDTLNNSDTSGAGDTANGFFDNFEDKDFGLSDIITMPLQTIKNISSATCKPLTFPIPFVNTNMSLPCMSEIYSKFGSVLTIYQTITFGMIAYWVVVNIFATVRNFKNPDSDEIEVVSL